MNYTCPDCGYSVNLRVPCGDFEGRLYCAHCYEDRHWNRLMELHPPTEEEILIRERISRLEDELMELKKRETVLKKTREAEYWKK